MPPIHFCGAWVAACCAGVFGLRPLGLSRLHRLDCFVVVVADHLW